jgi:hypothetical protein
MYDHDDSDASMIGFLERYASSLMAARPVTTVRKISMRST